MPLVVDASRIIVLADLKSANDEFTLSDSIKCFIDAITWRISFSAFDLYSIYLADWVMGRHLIDSIDEEMLMKWL